MSLDDLVAAQVAQVERAVPPNTTSLRRAVVTDDSPFTIEMNGVSIVGAAKSTRYKPYVGDVVLVLMDGAAPYVLEAVAGQGTDLVKHYVQTVITNASGNATITFPDGPFPTAISGIVHSLGNQSTNLGNSFKTAATLAGFTVLIVNSNTGVGLNGFQFEVEYYAWGY